MRPPRRPDTMRASTLIAPVAVLAVTAALLSYFSRGSSDAPRSLSAERGDPRATPAPAAEPAALSGVRRSVDGPVSDELRALGEPEVLASVEQPPVAPSAATGWEGLVRYADDQTPAAQHELVLQQGEVFATARTDAVGRFHVDVDFGVGVVDVRHRPDATNPLRMRFMPETVTLAPSSAGSPDANTLGARTFELWLARPEATLVVDAVALDGAAVEGAVVELELVSVGPTGAARHTYDRATTDDQGRARLALYDLDEVRAAGVVARLEGTAGAQSGAARGAPVAPRLTSALVRLDAPLHAPTLARPLRLVLDAPATVVVRVAAQDGAPLAGRAVLVDDMAPDLQWWLGGAPTTNERGEACAPGLPAGRYRVSLFDAPGSLPRELALVAGERAELEFVVAVPVLDFAASGRVVDEEGRPLAGRAVTGRVLDGAGPPRAVDAGTDDEGHFELRAAPGERIVVSASLGLFGDEYEPRELDVPFGTRDVVFRRTRTVPYETVAFEVVDASTGRLVRDVLVMTYRALAPGDYAFHTAEEGRARPRCSLHADTTCLLEAPGYRRRAVLATDLAATTPDGQIPRVTLEPGVLRELRVVDTAGRPVAGAVVSRGPTALGATDAAGRFVVDLTTWPDEGIVVTAEQHAPSTWKPRDGFADLAPAEVVLAGLAPAGG